MIGVCALSYYWLELKPGFWARGSDLLLNGDVPCLFLISIGIPNRQVPSQSVRSLSTTFYET